MRGLMRVGVGLVVLGCGAAAAYAQFGLGAELNTPLRQREGEDSAYFYQFSPDGYALGINVLLHAMTH